MLKRLHPRSGQRLRLQFHEHSVETLLVACAEAEILCDSTIKHFAPKAAIRVTSGAIHRIGAGDNDVELIEISAPELGDVIRLGEDYGRPHRT